MVFFSYLFCLREGWFCVIPSTNCKETALVGHGHSGRADSLDPPTPALSVIVCEREYESAWCRAGG